MAAGDAITEVVAGWADALRRDDLGEEFWSSDLEIVNAEGWVLEATYRGHDGLRKWWHDLAEAFSDFKMEIEEITPLDEERVLTVQRFVGRFRVTEIPIDAHWASVLTVRAGCIVHAIGYFTKAQALRASSK